MLNDTGLIPRDKSRFQDYKYDVCSSQELVVEASKIFDELQATKPLPAQLTPEPMSMGDRRRLSRGQ